MTGGSVRVRLHDLGRALIAAALRLEGFAAGLRHGARLRAQRRTGQRLRRRYRITDNTPLTRSLPRPRKAAGAGAEPVALTSGTSGVPKRVPYPAKRLRAVRGAFVDAMLRLIAAKRIRRPSLYVFGALRPDRSLTRLLLEERRPPRFVLLQAPYRAQSHPALLDLAERYGDAALRLLVLTVSNPGILYATNPSTLSTFFEELDADWERAVALARAVLGRPEALDPEALRILRRLRSAGDAARLARIAESDSPLPITVWAPAVSTFVCWTGGAVAPFLERLDRRLPAPRFHREPMFSISTETVETIPDFRDRETAFLPLAPGVLYEFLDHEGRDEGRDDAPDSAPEAAPPLLAPRELLPGRTYEMVASHGFGLRRYATGDLFRVERLVAGLPDLRFVRRRGLGWSFTGEKLTAEQVGSAFEILETEYPGLRARCWLALFPSIPGGGALPCYRLAAVPRAGAQIAPGAPADPPPEGLEKRLDRLLSRTNPEYRAKRESRRLGPVRLSRPDLAEFVRRASGRGSASPDAQFKFLPFYPRLWEDG